MSQEGSSAVDIDKAEPCYALYAVFTFFAISCTVLHCDRYLHAGA